MTMTVTVARPAPRPSAPPVRSPRAEARASVGVPVVALLCGAVILGCGSTLPTPARSAHRDTDFNEVPFPPPAIRGDKIPKRPSDASVWLDGEWRWQGRRWIWVSGSWVTPPAGARFARWDVRRTGTTTTYAPGIFFLPDGSTLDPDTLREARRVRAPDVPCVAPDRVGPDAAPPAPASAGVSTGESTGTSTLYPPCAAESP